MLMPRRRAAERRATACAPSTCAALHGSNPRGPSGRRAARRAPPGEPDPTSQQALAKRWKRAPATPRAERGAAHALQHHLCAASATCARRRGARVRAAGARKSKGGVRPGQCSRIRATRATRQAPQRGAARRVARRAPATDAANAPARGRERGPARPPCPPVRGQTQPSTLNFVPIAVLWPPPCCAAPACAARAAHAGRRVALRRRAAMADDYGEDVAARPSGAAQDSDIAELRQAWINEKAAPEILPCVTRRGSCRLVRAPTALSSCRRQFQAGAGAPPHGADAAPGARRSAAVGPPWRTHDCSTACLLTDACRVAHASRRSSC